MSNGLRSRAPVVFVVEDDPATKDLLCELAQEAGWKAAGFTRLAELEEALDRLRPTLLVLDDDLPDGRGGDVARDMHDDPRLSGTRTLVCTAAHPSRQAEIGAWAPVVSKPFDLGQFERFLDDAARQHVNGNHAHGPAE